MDEQAKKTAFLAPEAETVVALLYARLFEIAPNLEPLFHTDVRTH